jgi:phenylacetate-CoA ligase
MDLSSLFESLNKSQWEKRSVPPLKGPILTRYDLQKMSPPKGDFVSRTSGATGISVAVQRTNLSKLWWNATNLREVIWHKRDISESIAIIRPLIQRELVQKDWGPAFSLLGKSGLLYGHPIEGDLNGWLQKIQPGYLMTFPSILETIDLKALTRLKGIKTTGETLRQKHPLIADMYSCEEVGTIAIQCPDNPEMYHVMENIIVEILDEQNQPANIGKVVITDLTSHYLYRYEIGDYAELGTCFCGRGLQTIKNILGRRRNMVVLPDGSKHWPLIGSSQMSHFTSVKRYQVAQVDAMTIELRLMLYAPLSEKEKEALISLIQGLLGYPFDVRFVYIEDFPKGKFEDFVNPYLLSLDDQKSQVMTGQSSASS